MMKKVNLDSDLIIEFAEFMPTKRLQKNEHIRVTQAGSGITKTDIKLNNNNIYGRPKGEYITYDMDEKLLKSSELIESISADLKRLITKAKSVLVIGVGNEILISDSLGPRAIDLVNIKEGNVFKLNPSVSGNTGIESETLIKSVAKIIKPDAIIIVDSLCSRKFTRVGRSFQISTAGLTPGSAGGKSNLAELCKRTLGTKVIAVGVPTVVNVGSVVLDVTNNLKLSQEDATILNDLIFKEMALNGAIMCPKDIDYLIDFCAKVISSAINKALEYL